MRGVVAFGMLLLGGSVAGTAWWLGRPEASPADTPPAADATDVYCTGRVDAAGQVVGLDPARPGRVVAVLVAEGDSVTEGQPLVKLDAAAAEAQLVQAEAAVEAAEIELDAARREKERFPGQLAARTHLVNASAARVEAARKLLQQRRDQQGVAPLGKAEAEAHDAQVRELELMEAAQRGELDDLKRVDLDLRVRGAQAKLRGAQADRALAAKAVAECTVTAPSDGTVLRLGAAAGGAAAPGSPLPAVVFAPAGPLVVRAEVDQEYLGLVAAGMRVEAQDENRAGGPVWAGRVARVGPWVAQRRTFVLEPGELNDVRTVECVIELDPSAAPLWIGQRMRVRIARPAPAETPPAVALRSARATAAGGPAAP